MPHLLDEIENWLLREDLFDRERKSTHTRALGILLYHAGLSCRATSNILTELVEPVSHNPISDWYRRCADLFRKQPIKRHEVLVVDETTILLEHENGELEEYFLWVAINPKTGEIVHVALTQGRSGVEALGFTRGVLKRCTNVPYFLVDGGVWYPFAFRLEGVGFEVMRGGDRNKVETWNGVLKQRIRAFRERFPHNASHETIQNWCLGFAFLWNQAPWSRC